MYEIPQGSDLNMARLGTDDQKHAAAANAPIAPAFKNNTSHTKNELLMRLPSKDRKPAFDLVLGFCMGR
jgi:hypothetical protein